MKPVMLITGTSRGIGAYLVDYYAQRGYTVVGCSRSALEQPSAASEHFILDVADEPAVVAMVRSVASKYGRIDVLLNNAGIASMNHCLLTPLSTVRNVFSTNVFGTMLFAREAAKVMLKRKYGRIVNFATVATPLKLEGEAAYAASKAAVRTYTEIMAREFAPFGITVNAVGPTPVETDLIRSVPKQKIKALIDMQAVRRLGEFRDISNVVDFFVAPQSDFVTGQTIYLGGVS